MMPSQISSSINWDGGEFLPFADSELMQFEHTSDRAKIRDWQLLRHAASIARTGPHK